MKDETKGQEEVSEEVESQEDNQLEEETESPESIEETTSEEEIFEVDGEEYTADQIRELKKGVLRQEDYTAKTQEVAELRKAYESLMPKQRTEREENSENYPPEQKEAVDFINNIVEKRLAERLSPLREEQEDIKVQKEIEDLQTKNDLSKEEIKEVLTKARDLKLPLGSLESAYKIVAFDKKQEEARKTGERKATSNLEQRKAAITESSKSSAKEGKESTYKRGDTYNDVTNRLKKTLGF